MTIQVRLYRPEDYAACRALWVELTQRHRDIYNDETIGAPDPGRSLDTYLADPHRHATWVAEIDGQIVGMAGLVLLNEEEADVEPVVVTSARRSQGVGSLLVQEAVTEAKAIGIRFLNARPVARNKAAAEFFVDAGFDIVGHVDLFQDLAPEKGRQWETGITIHGKKLRH